MSGGNRVEALETRVAELEATVEGLTEELVAANERIRQIEAALGGSMDATAPDDDGEVLESGGWGPGDSETVADGGTRPAEDDPATAEADKSGETEGGDDGELDDIIVA